MLPHDVLYNIDLLYLAVLLSLYQNLLGLHPNSERNLAHEMMFTEALTRTLLSQLIARLTFMCNDPTTYLMLRCGSGSTPGAVANDDPDLRLALRTAANYFEDDAGYVPSRLNASEYGGRLVADCNRRKDIYTSWSHFLTETY